MYKTTINDAYSNKLLAFITRTMQRNLLRIIFLPRSPHYGSRGRNELIEQTSRGLSCMHNKYLVRLTHRKYNFMPYRFPRIFCFSSSHPPNQSKNNGLLGNVLFFFLFVFDVWLMVERQYYKITSRWIAFCTKKLRVTRHNLRHHGVCSETLVPSELVSWLVHLTHVQL